MERGDLIMGSLWVVFQEVRKCLQRGDSEEKESGHKGLSISGIKAVWDECV